MAESSRVKLDDFNAIEGAAESAARGSSVEQTTVDEALVVDGVARGGTLH